MCHSSTLASYLVIYDRARFLPHLNAKELGEAGDKGGQAELLSHTLGPALHTSGREQRAWKTISHKEHRVPCQSVEAIKQRMNQDLQAFPADCPRNPRDAVEQSHCASSIPGSVASNCPGMLMRAIRDSSKC